MPAATIGLVLVRMASEAKKRAEHHGHRRERDAAHLMWSLHFVLMAGAECLDEIDMEEGD